MKLIDSHCHLQDERIFGNLPALMARAHAMGVKGFICCGSSPDDWSRVKKISETYPGVIPAYGIHPWYVDKAPANWLDMLKNFLNQPGSLVGEIGLDLKFTKIPLETQEKAFRLQMEMAIALKRPVSCHCVKAWHHLLPLLKEYAHTVPIQLHSYNGGPGMVEQLLNLHCYFSFSGSLTRSKNKKAHRALEIIPVHRLLIESDAPDIPPEINGTIDFDTPNEPTTLKWIIQHAANMLALDVNKLADQLLENTRHYLSSPQAFKD